MDSRQAPIRILAVADIWQGSNAYAYVRAFRRLGHSVKVLPPENFIPGGWESRPLRVVRRLLLSRLVAEFNNALIREAEQLKPQLFFVFKGRYVTAQTIRAMRRMGAVAINFYPDVSFLAHGKFIPEALPVYDWVFTTKSFGVQDMERLLGIRHASFLPHSFDPETHAPVALDEDDHRRYDCEVSFIGTWSPKKQQYLETVSRSLPELHLRIWGAQWEQAVATLGQRVQGKHVLGLEYAKALVASKINLAILSEARQGASSGDRITSRTFHIPATGAFMLHERTEELPEYFEEGSECACFATAEEMVEKIGYYLENEDKRLVLAQAGRRRSLDSGYGVDQRALVILEKAAALQAIRQQVVGV